MHNLKGVGRQEVKILREKTDLKVARTGGYRRSAVWRPCGVTLHAALQNKSVVCSGSRVTNSTVMKLHGSVNRGGIIVKTCTKSTCSHIQTLSRALPPTHPPPPPHAFHSPGGGEGGGSRERETIPYASLSPPDWLLHYDGQQWQPISCFH